MSTRDTRVRCKLETNIYHECHTRRQRKLDLRAANARKIRGERGRVETCQGGEDHIVVFRYTHHGVSDEDACGGILEYGCREEQDPYRTRNWIPLPLREFQSEAKRFEEIPLTGERTPILTPEPTRHLHGPRT